MAVSTLTSHSTFDVVRGCNIWSSRRSMVGRRLQLIGQSCRWLRATQTAGVDSEPDVGLELISTGSFLNVAACGSGRSVAVSPDGWKLNAYRHARQPINE